MSKKGINILSLAPCERTNGSVRAATQKKISNLCILIILWTVLYKSRIIVDNLFYDLQILFDIKEKSNKTKWLFHNQSKDKQDHCFGFWGAIIEFPNWAFQINGKFY